MGTVYMLFALKAEIVGLFIVMGALRGQTVMAGTGFNLSMQATAAGVVALTAGFQALAAPEEIIV
jgi:hypothetical protein